MDFACDNLFASGSGRALERARIAVYPEHVSTKANSIVRSMIRETGIAVAVLAIYVLTLLLPLHQAAGLQRDFNALGFATLDSWSICQPMAQDENGDKEAVAALICPATGIAKHELAAVLPPSLTLGPQLATLAIGLAAPRTPLPAHLPDHIGQSRAPPVAV